MKTLITKLLKLSSFEQISVLFGYLRISGWLKSLYSKKPIDVDGKPLPWYTYSFIHFLNCKFESLEKKANTNFRVFEFGSGNSTLWWANKVKSVIAVEDNISWFNIVKKSLPDNVSYHFADNKESYINVLLSYSNKFEIIIIDGSYRQDCIENSINFLSDEGIIIVDNSDWQSLKSPISKLKDKGFSQIPFKSLGPVNGHPWETTIFYRPKNCLKL